jgi:hypothetical protein
MSNTTHSGNPSRIQAPDSTRKLFQRTILNVHTVLGHIYFSSGHTQTSLFLLISPLLPTRHIRTDSPKIKGVQQ